MRDQNPRKFRFGRIAGALGSGVLIAQLSAAFAQTPSTPLAPPFGPAVTLGQTLQLSDMTNRNPLIPADIYRNGDNTVSHRDLATFAWLEFISAVAPAANGSRGVPGGSFVQSGRSGPDQLLVWETYQHRTELFPCTESGPSIPQTWGSPPTYVVAKANPNFGAKPETNSSGAGCTTVTVTNPPKLPFNNLDEASQIGQNFLFFPQTPGNPDPQNDGQVLFEAKVNQYESDFIAANAGKLTPPITLPAGTVEVKAAWRPLSSIPPQERRRYHIATVLTYTGTEDSPTPVMPLEQYALVALHIIHKTPNYPAFIFATFEQVDAYQDQATDTPPQSVTTPKPSGVYYVPTYTAIEYVTPPTTDIVQKLPSGPAAANPASPLVANNTTPQTPPKFPVNNPTIQLPNGTTFSHVTPQAAPFASSPPIPLPKEQVARISGAKPIPGTSPTMYTVPVVAPVSTVPDVAEVNNEALALMQQVSGGPDFIWQYYKLTGVQAIPTSDETAKDFYLANIVVESSQPGIQLFRGFPTIDKSGLLTNFRNQVNVVDFHNAPGSMAFSAGGCQGCHGVAQTQFGSDFSFLVSSSNGRQFKPDPKGLPTTPAALAAHLAKRNYIKQPRGQSRPPGRQPRPGVRPVSCGAGAAWPSPHQRCPTLRRRLRLRIPPTHDPR